jgi:hypothetical protein
MSKLNNGKQLLKANKVEHDCWLSSHAPDSQSLGGGYSRIKYNRQNMKIYNISYCIIYLWRLSDAWLETEYWDETCDTKIVSEFPAKENELVIAHRCFNFPTDGQRCINPYTLQAAFKTQNNDFDGCKYGSKATCPHKLFTKCCTWCHKETGLLLPCRNLDDTIIKPCTCGMDCWSFDKPSAEVAAKQKPLLKSKGKAGKQARESKKRKLEEAAEDDDNDNSRSSKKRKTSETDDHDATDDDE